jgi:hypothetical protein
MSGSTTGSGPRRLPSTTVVPVSERTCSRSREGRTCSSFASAAMAASSGPPMPLVAAIRRPIATATASSSASSSGGSAPPEPSW